MTTEVSEPRTKLLTSAYSAAASGRLDEAFTDNGTLREHWRYVLSSLEGLGAGGLDERAQKIARILRDDGATYNVHTDPLGPLRTTWSLDPIPMVLDSAQWQTIEAGLLERAELLNLMLRDLYGPRELLTRRVLPPELVFSNPGFLRACHGAQLAGEHDLILHATDLVRTADGSFCAVADSTQSPAGAGYALENRLVMSRVFPSLFRESQVHRLALFFRTLRSTLDRLAHSHTDEPRVVVLTPGSFNDNYFEHTFLANYLGYALVQGSDLTCRDGYLWVKSVGGLERVDAVVRRVEDSLCDPVELRGDSRLGVAGLLDVARNGNVIIANPIGTGVLENPGLLKYFGALGQHYLGREPRLPSVQTWWCGEPADFAYVRDHLDELVIKSTFASAAAQTYVPAQMSKDDTQQLLRRIAERPNRFAAQPLLDMSQTPTWRDQRLAASPMALRGFCVAADGAYQVLPGGLVRVGAREELLVGGAPAGSLSKDVWVLASEPERQVSLLSDTGGVERLDVPQSSLPSRVVENLFWMGRYAERAEYAIRLLRTVFMQLNPELNLGGQLTSEAQTALLRAVTLLTGTGPGFLANDTELLAKPESELLSVILDSSRPGSVTSNVLSMLRASVDVQEELSADTRRVLNDIRDELGQLEASLAGGLSSAPEEALDPLITYLSSLAGLSNESMMHGMGLAVCAHWAAYRANRSHRHVARGGVASRLRAG